MMPDVDGFDVLRAIRTNPVCQTVRVVMYSALADPSSRKKAFELGADDYVVKGTGFAGIEALLRHSGHGGGGS